MTEQDGLVDAAATEGPVTGLDHAGTIIRKSRVYIGTGIACVVLAIIYMVLGSRLPFGQMDQPGAAVFPMVVGVVLIVASISAIVEGWATPSSETIELPAGPNLARLLKLLGLFVAYIILMPFLGQVPTSFLFSVALLRVLSSMGWLRLLLTAAVMALILNLFFIGLFNVPLPRGPLAFW